MTVTFDSRVGILSISILILIGAVMMRWVDVDQGRKDAMQEDARNRGIDLELIRLVIRSSNRAISRITSIGPPIRNIERGSGGNEGPKDSRSNHRNERLSVTVFLSTTSALISIISTKGIWKLTMEPMYRPMMNPIQERSCQVESNPAALASFAKYSNKNGISTCGRK